MTMGKLDYTFDFPNKGILSPEEVHFFYYDVMRDTEDNIQVIYEWNNDIESFLKEKGIKASIMEKDALLQNVEKNEIYFSLSEDEALPLALFRHLRNAFVHHRIVYSGDYLSIEDTNGKDLKMKGLVKYKDLKELCFLFFKQKDDFEKNNGLLI